MSWNISSSFQADELFRNHEREEPQIAVDGFIRGKAGTLDTEPGPDCCLSLSSRGIGMDIPSTSLPLGYEGVLGEHTLGPSVSDVFSSIPSSSSTKSGISPLGKRPNKKKYQRLPRNAVEVLQSWVFEHQNYPYPNVQEINSMAQQSGLKTTQVSNWFANTRRRKGFGTENSLKVGRPVNSMSPLERWQNSPPEYESATTSDIMRALAETPYPDITTAQHTSDEGWSSQSSSASFTLRSAYVGSFTHSHSSGSDVLPGGPQTARPPTPLPGKSSRRRRRKPERQSTPWEERKVQRKRIYQCTFCSDSFLTKYDWQRHEKALHLSVDRWTCAPEGGIREKDGTLMCEFCEATGVCPDHLEMHNYLACREKGLEARKFIRKDHLQQHLKLVHHVNYRSPMDRWRDSESPLVSRCGFCGATLENWQNRVDHISDHFKKGADMVQWKGDWGFEPNVQGLVKNAMPPFLLGQERHTMDPWKMTDTVGAQGDEDSAFHMNVPNGLDRYMDLRRDLVAYIQSEIAGGLCPSDQQIQDKARQMAYGSDDPWDQTYADDPVWLTALKSEVSGQSNDVFDCFDMMPKV